MFRSKIAKIISGGQTGCDRAALDFGINNNFEIGGWCPRDGWAEDYPKSPGLLKDYPQLKSTHDDNVAQRTYRNIVDADATIVFCPENLSSPGTNTTIALAEIVGKPFFVYKDENDFKELVSWFDRLSDKLIINIAGPRQSEFSSAYDMTSNLLKRLFSEQ